MSKLPIFETFLSVGNKLVKKWVSWLRFYESTGDYSWLESTWVGRLYSNLSQSLRLESTDSSWTAKPKPDLIAFQMNMVYQDLVKMQQNIVKAGERKYEYDSDEDTEVKMTQNMSPLFFFSVIYVY